jgi:hypothetical protein
MRLMRNRPRWGSGLPGKQCLYDATVANYLQILGAVGGFLEKSLTHFQEKGIDPAEIVQSRLAHDMLPLRFQIVSVAHHSRGAMEAAKTGVFTPPSAKPDLDYAALRWFWAVLTAYLLFINVRSRGETIFKGIQRLWGALAGLAVGLLVSFTFAGHPAFEAAGIFVCLFGLGYSFPIFPALSTFCVTILFGLAYSLAGAQVGTVLTLRLEETGIGVASALISGIVPPIE